MGHCVNHKKVYRLMQELGLKCVTFMRKSRQYNSYKGKVGTVAKNPLNRRFHTTIPLQKLVTDVTKFKCTGERKLYLSPIIDLYNGEVIAYGMNNLPTLDFVMKPLQEAVGIIRQHGTVRTTLHSDQGWHYQHKQLLQILKQHRLFQSMFWKECIDWYNHICSKKIGWPKPSRIPNSNQPIRYIIKTLTFRGRRLST